MDGSRARESCARPRRMSKRLVSELALPLPPPRPAIRVDDQPVQGPGPGPLPGGDRAGAVDSEAAGRPRPPATAVAPRIQRAGRLSKAEEALDWIDQPVIRLHSQMLAPQAESQRSGEPPGALSPPREVDGLAGISVPLQDGEGEFGVVGPRAPVHVVRADHRQDIVY